MTSTHGTSPSTSPGSSHQLALHELHDGGGVPLVLLHAFPLDHRVWAPLAERLPFAVRAVAVDLPGHGHSNLPQVPPSLDVAADAVYRTLLAHGIGNGIVVGLSMGGYVALALAERHPGFVAGLGLVDTKSTADTDEARANRLRIARDVEEQQTVDPVLGMPAVLLGETSVRERRHLLHAVESWIHGQTPSSVAWSQRAMAARPDRTHVIEAFDGPVSVVVGTEDTITPLAEAEHMVKVAQDGALTVIPGVGHLSALEDPGPVAAALSLLHRRVVRRHR